MHPFDSDHGKMAHKQRECLCWSLILGWAWAVPLPFAKCFVICHTLYKIHLPSNLEKNLAPRIETPLRSLVGSFLGTPDDNPAVRFILL